MPEFMVGYKESRPSGTDRPTMLKKIAIAELAQRIQTVLEDITSQHAEYVLLQGDQPQAAVVPYDEFCRFQDFRESAIRRRWDRLLDRMAERNARFSEEEVAAEVEAARGELDG